MEDAEEGGEDGPEERAKPWFTTDQRMRANFLTQC